MHNKINIAKECLIILFFFQVATLCVEFHSRDYFMLDYTITFDHWWYFYDRLRGGSLAQWNPYVLMGKLNVLWNYIPVSIFSPFLYLFGLTLDTWHYFQIAGLFLEILAVYLVGRLMGYGRICSLLPTVLIMTGGYRYFSSLPHHATSFFCYPLALVCLLSAFKANPADAFVKYALFLVFLSIAFLGKRMEEMVYCLSFISLIFVVFGGYCYKNKVKMLSLFFLGVCAVAVVIAANTWQLSFLVNSTIDSIRIRRHSAGFGVLFDWIFWKYVFLSLMLQSPMILSAVNLASWAILRRKKSAWLSLTSPGTIASIIGAELFFLWVLLNIKLQIMSKTLPDVKNVDIVFSVFGIVAMALAISIWLMIVNKRNLEGMLRFFAALFAGFYVVEYSWHTWPVHNLKPWFFFQPQIASFASLGAVNLLRKKKIWMLAVLVAYHFFGETGAFFLFELVGMPWLASRAALVEIPFQVILLLEAIQFLSAGTLFLTTRIFDDKQSFMPIARQLKAGAALATLLFVFISARNYIMPAIELVRFPGDNKHHLVKAYKWEFPFYPQKVGEKSKNTHLTAAYQYAQSVRSATQNEPNHFKRTKIDDSILKWTTEEMYYHFLPSYSQNLNTALVYSSEVSIHLKNIFSPAEADLQLLPPHPEMNPLFTRYKYQSWEMQGLSKVSYGADFLVRPHATDTPFFREIMAEEGTSQTPRAFLTQRVLKFKDRLGERVFLDEILAKNHSLAEQITTSDPTFSPMPGDPNERDIDSTPPFQSLLEFKTDAPENVVLYSYSNSNAFLALLDLWDRGWKAFVDGKETVIYKGYIGTRFIRLTEGSHIIEFKYQVPGLLPSALVSIITWVLLALLLLVACFRRNWLPRFPSVHNP